MKTIKIFLASSEELANDRLAFGDLIRRLDEIYEKRGIRIKLFKWDDYDAAFNDRRKQDEYNDEIRASDMFIALFHTKAGQFTIEEFNIATEEFSKNASPKVYTYCKDLKENEQETAELAAFKKKLFEELGHYWCRYGNRDTMQLHFVMQLQLVENNQRDDLKLENGVISLGGMTIARMDQLQFASGNEAYQKMSNELSMLPEEIKKAEERMKKYPDDQDLVDDWQKKIKRYNELDKEFTQLQRALFATAKQISKMQLEQTNAKVHRAFEAFEEGNLELANFLLEEVAHEADQHMAQLDQDRMLVHNDIDALLLQANTVLADTSINIEERIARVDIIYEKADDWAKKSNYDEEKHLDLLWDYARFLVIYAKYDKALEIIERIIELFDKVYGEDYLDHAYYIYSFVASVYSIKGQFDDALEFYFKSLNIQEEDIDDFNKLEIAKTYDSIGCIYAKKGDLEQALQYYSKALDIRTNELYENQLDTVFSYINIGDIFRVQGKPKKGIDYLLKAINILPTTNETSSVIVNINTQLGLCYSVQGDFPKAMEYYQKALEMQIREYGINHPTTSILYNSIGTQLYETGYYTESLDYLNKALSIQRKLFGDEHLEIAFSYDSIGLVYNKIGDTKKAYSYFSKALSIRESSSNPIDLATSYGNMALISIDRGNLSEAIDYNLKALAIKEKTIGANHSDVVSLYVSIGQIYSMQEKYQKAKEYLQKALAIQENTTPQVRHRIAQTHILLGSVYSVEKDYTNALSCFKKAIEIQNEVLDKYHWDKVETYRLTSQTFLGLSEYDKALELLQNAIEIIDNNPIQNYLTTSSVYGDLGVVYLYKEDYSTALDYFNKALSHIEKTDDSESHRRLLIYNTVTMNIGLTYYYLGDYENTLKTCLKVLPTIENTLGLKHIQTTDLYNLIGTAYHKLKDYPSALQYYEKALAICIEVLGENHPKTQAIMQNIEMISPAIQHKKPSRNFFSRWSKK